MTQANPERLRPYPSVDWTSGMRGLLIGIALAGLSSSLDSPWLLVLALVAFGQTLLTSFGLSRRESIVALSWIFLRAVVTVSVFVMTFVVCAMLVNTPVRAISIAGGVAMIALLAFSAMGLAAHGFRVARGPVSVAPAVIVAFVRLQASWAAGLAVLQLEQIGMRRAVAAQAAGTH